MSETEVKPSIGEVAVIKGEPPDGNPYRGDSLMFNERIFALWRFFHGKKIENLSFWCVPCEGGAYRITSPDKINWETSGIPQLKGEWVSKGEILRCKKCGKEVGLHGGLIFWRMTCRCDNEGL